MFLISTTFGTCVAAESRGESGTSIVGGFCPHGAWVGDDDGRYFHSTREPENGVIVHFRSAEGKVCTSGSTFLHNVGSQHMRVDVEAARS